MRFLPLTVAAALLLSIPLHAAPPSAALLPGTTKLYVTAPDTLKLEQAWKKTKLAELFSDSKLKPFFQDFLQESTLAKLGIDWNDLTSITAGEMSMAVVPVTANETAHVLILDAKGRQAAIDKALAKVTASLKKHGYKVGPEVVDGVMIRTFKRPSGAKRNRRDESIYCMAKGEVVVATNDVRAIELILKRWQGNAPDRLAEKKAYQEVLARSKEKLVIPAELFWFAEPIGLAEMERNVIPAAPRRSVDMLKVLKEEGFAAIQGVGGWISFGQGQYDLVHHTAVYAPGPYQKSMRMVKTTSGEDFAPQAWVPDTVARFDTAYIDLKSAFQYFDSFFDAVWGDGVPGTFKNDILRGLRDDPNGPQIDVAKEVIGRLGQRVTMIADSEKPIGINSIRSLAAAQTNDEKGLANAIRRMMENDEDVKKHVLAGGTVLWEMITKEKKKKKGAKPAPPQPKSPNGAVAVAQGQLFMASDIKLLQKILTNPGKGLATEADYQRVALELGKQGAAKDCLRSFSRPDEDFYPIYELLRTNQIEKSKSLYAKILVELLGENVTQLEGSRFPDYENFRRYLGPSGNFGDNATDGWFVKGFVLRKQ